MEIDTLNLDCVNECAVVLRIDFALTQLNKDANLISDDNSLVDKLLNMRNSSKNNIIFHSNVSVGCA